MPGDGQVMSTGIGIRCANTILSTRLSRSCRSRFTLNKKGFLPTEEAAPCLGREEGAFVMLGSGWIVLRATSNPLKALG
ncbi:hypothetical protein D3C76_1173850 [compost metagenome]